MFLIIETTNNPRQNNSTEESRTEKPTLALAKDEAYRQFINRPWNWFSVYDDSGECLDEHGLADES